MLLRLCLIAVSGAVLGTLPRAEGYTWPAIRYSPPNACGKNETFDQNSFVCIRCGRAERPRDTAEGGFVVRCSFQGSFVTEVMVNLRKLNRALSQVMVASVGRITGWSRIQVLTGRRRMG